MANEHSQIVPSMQPTSTVADFKFWCQKVLPLVYDDSISYYEVLGKMVVYLNQVIDNINADTANVAELEDDFLLLQTYVNNFFDDIDQLVTYAERAEAAETAALSSAASAAESATNAASSAVNAATSSGSAATSALSAMDAKDATVAAKTAAEAALASAQTAATNAANSATAASNSATAASGSATAASGSATNAASSAASALQNFQLSDSARVAAQQAAEDAETAAETFTTDTTLSVSGKAADAKATGDAIDDVEDDVSELKTAFNDIAEVTSVNIFDEQYPTVGLLKTDGTINENSSYGTSGYIPVDASNDTLYLLRSMSPFVIYACFYTEESESAVVDSRITVQTTTSIALRTTISIPATAKYFRISKPNSPNSTICISYSMVEQYVPYNPVAKIKDTAIDVDKIISGWYADNFNEKENLLENATYKLQGSVGFPVYDKVKGNAVAYKLISTDGSDTDIRFTLPEAINLIGVQAFDLEFYLENANNITNLQLSTFTPSASTYSRTIPASQLVNGWNHIRINTAQQDILTEQTWSTASVFRIVTHGTGAFTITISAIYVERMGKAKVIFVDDHGYHDFMTLAYPILKEAGCPVTWALNPGRLGATIGTYCSILTQNDIESLADDPYSEFSFHSWDATATENMSADNVRADIQKCLTYLKKNGICPDHVWRAAWVQNKATNWWVAQDMIEGCATHDASGSSNLFPFANIYNIPRYGIHGRASTDIDAFFTAMKLTHTTFVLYTHGCVEEQYEGNTLHATVGEVTYVANKIATGISEGWLECTTFNRLKTMEEHGMLTLTD